MLSLMIRCFLNYKKEEILKIRIYYECLEQANFYIKEAIKVVNSKLNLNINDIELIQKEKQTILKDGRLSKLYSQSLNNILLHKNPDAIITVINENNIEIPLSIIEFSTATFTKDHELQRADNFKVAKDNNLIYIKISPLNKKSKGYNFKFLNYEHLEQYSVLYKNHKLLSFHVDWDTLKDDFSILSKHDLYKSMPTNNNYFTNILELIFKSYNDDKEKWYNKLSQNNTNSKIKEWIDSIKNHNIDDIKNFNNKRLLWEDKHQDLNIENTFTITFNRMGHALDPERGTLSYYSTFFKKDNYNYISRFVFTNKKETWFKTTSNENKIRNIMKEGIKSSKDLYNIFILGLSFPNSNEITIKEGKYLDITEYINNNYQYMSSSLKTLISCSNYIQLENDKKEIISYIKWSKNIIMNNVKTNNKLTKVEPKKNFTEDDVTYVNVHDLFIKNNIKPISVSYAGSQSDTPLLPNPNKGISQERVYIDAIGIKEKTLILQENKGLLRNKPVQNDIDKISKFKDNVQYIKSLNVFKDKYKIHFDNLLLGIGFIADLEKFKISSLNLKSVDYLFVISKDFKTFKLFKNNKNTILPFSEKELEINIENTLKVLKNNL